MNREDLEGVLDSAADDALKARARIEAAVEAGEVPAWVLEFCEAWERSALMYGAARAKLSGGNDSVPTAVTMPASSRFH